LSGQLENKVAVVTGGGRGIGRGVALFLAQEGAKLVVADPGSDLDGSGSSNSIADSVVTEIQDQGGEAVSTYESVTTMSGGDAIINKALDTFGKLDIVVTCAGVLRDRMIFNMTEEEWDSVIAVHLKGTFTIVKHAAILFRQQRSGRIITFSSESGLIGNSGQANYGAAKSGIAGFTKVVARDMGKYGVTANSIAPRANTRMISAIPNSASQIRTSQGLEPISGESELESAHPDAIAPFVGYLASDYAANVNGQTFLVYGGTISLISQPRAKNSIFNGVNRWDLATLATISNDYLTKGISNPAPLQNKNH
jgi:hypothetical protein